MISKSTIYKNSYHQSRERLIAVIILTISLVLFVPTLTLRASAEPASTSPVYTACLKALEKAEKARVACQDDQTLQQARNVATWHCEDVPFADDKKSECIESKAIKYIQEAATPRPHSAREYTNRLTKVLKTKGGSLTSASTTAGSSTGNLTANLGTTTTSFHCGHKDSNNDKDQAIATSINIGCKGQGNAIMDLMFAIIRFLSNGAGLVIIGSLVLGGIQYTISRGDPQGTATAINRIRSVMFALLLFIFSYAILNYLIPGQLLK